MARVSLFTRILVILTILSPCNSVLLFRGIVFDILKFPLSTIINDIDPFYHDPTKYMCDLEIFIHFLIPLQTYQIQCLCYHFILIARGCIKNVFYNLWLCQNNNTSVIIYHRDDFASIYANTSLSQHEGRSSNYTFHIEFFHMGLRFSHYFGRMDIFGAQDISTIRDVISISCFISSLFLMM